MALQWSVSVLIAIGFALLVFYCLCHINYALSTTPPEVDKLVGEPWTEEKLKNAYEKYKQERPDFRKHLPPKQARRYIVFGGSGLVGGWIVEHLIMRGQDPATIRIADLQAPRRQYAVEKNVPYFQTDVTDPTSIARIFNHPWPAEASNLPLTVFHTVAYIHAGHRHPDLLPKYMQVNVDGTKNVIAASRVAGCDIFIATSSASIGIRPSKFIFPPWVKYPGTFVQFADNAEPEDLDGSLDQFAGCYAYSKAKAEKVVRNADDKESGFRTGAIRPGHAIYGHGDENSNSVAYDYLRRGELLSWMGNLVVQFVSAQNVSLAHLIYEARIHSANPDIGGKAYCVCDPSPPFRYSDLFRLFSTIVHPATPMRFHRVPPLVLMMISYAVEAYVTIQRRYLGFLPEVKGDLQMLQPVMFSYLTLNILYDDSLARKELGYNPGYDTLEGLCEQVLEWNEAVEAKLAGGKEARNMRKDVQGTSFVEKTVPVASRGVAK
ncbi:uncharacterized protein Z518_00637 [Rhinocladiella mackenziei CBS 650.93]|uniref:3-beta hydroxysteroid dehydrogenase/isomerase domain-containing protein n=1 Tax=Rhinocladiella mackenziei CBS 650.93 TaxID=1442369 RepID=A0A0D2G4G1_9EURO|nr:uncharacterized protein Z518_00637 [Rhinocladiella mackenziei CBS 650.93]KIX09557.1 hypothetical protein Z518_00637 [Rhinocladiella mackenziei CBS 650.93]